MKNKLLIILLVVLGALLALETGYLLGVGQGRKSRRLSVNRYPNLRQQGPAHKAWDSGREITVMQENMDRMFDDDFPRTMPMKRPAGEKRGLSFVTAMTSSETNQAHIITINLPGMDKEAINLEVKGRYLTVQTRQNKEASRDSQGFYVEEVSTAGFMQTVRLPDDANISQISAQYSKDTLTITIPKEKKTKEVSAAAIKIPVK